MKQPTEEEILKARRFFRPKLKEVNEQCTSCPFRDDNDVEFGEIILKLAKLHKVKSGDPQAARLQVRDEVTMNGEFRCHLTVYDKDMGIKDQSEHRQCAGATEWFRTHAPTQERKWKE